VSNAAIFNNTGSIASPGYGNIALASYNPITGFQSPISGPISPTTFESHLAEIGLFTYHEFKFGDQWLWSFGARGTATFAHDTTPVVGSLATAVDDATLSLEPNITSSLSYKPVPTGPSPG
jgi:hypothetical protein